MLKQKLQLSYSGLFSRGANFPKLSKWAHDLQLGKFIVDRWLL